MTIAELKQEIENLPNNMEVLIDNHQGQGMSVEYVESNYVVKKNRYDFDLYDVNWNADDACLEENEWEKLKKTSKVCLLNY